MLPIRETVNKLIRYVDLDDPDAVQVIKELNEFVNLDLSTCIAEFIEAVDKQDKEACLTSMYAVISAREAIDGRRTNISIVFEDVCSYLINKGEYGQIYGVMEEWKQLATPPDHPQDYRATECISCGARLRKGSTVCSTCGKVISLSREEAYAGTPFRTSKSVMKAMKVLSTVNWEVSIQLLYEQAVSADADGCAETVDTILTYLRSKHGRGNKLIGNFHRASTWFIANEEWNGLANYARDLRRVVTDDILDKACGSLIQSCQNPICRVRYIDDNKDLFICPDCGKTRTFCMIEGEPPDGRCAKHSLMLTETNKKRYNIAYEFRADELAYRMKKFVENPEVLDSKAQIALVDLRIDQLTRSISGIDSDVLRSVLEEHLELSKELAKISESGIEEENTAKLIFAVNQYMSIIDDLWAVLESNTKDKELWLEIRDNLETRRRQAEVALKREIANQHVITLTQFTEELVKLSKTFLGHLTLVDDPMLQHQIRTRIMTDVRHMLEANSIVEGEYEEVKVKNG